MRRAEHQPHQPLGACDRVGLRGDALAVVVDFGGEQRPPEGAAAEALHHGVGTGWPRRAGAAAIILRHGRPRQLRQRRRRDELLLDVNRLHQRRRGVLVEGVAARSHLGREARGELGDQRLRAGVGSARAGDGEHAVEPAVAVVDLVGVGRVGDPVLLVGDEFVGPGAGLQRHLGQPRAELGLPAHRRAASLNRLRPAVECAGDVHLSVLLLWIRQHEGREAAGIGHAGAGDAALVLHGAVDVCRARRRSEAREHHLHGPLPFAA